MALSLTSLKMVAPPFDFGTGLPTVAGPYRAFEDGTVEMLASPVPPCQGGDYYVWISFPK